METRFVFPLTVATALHALVLFGVKWPHSILDELSSKTAVQHLIPCPIPVELEPPENERDEWQSPARAVKGDSTAFTPQLNEVPTNHVAIFEQPAQRNRRLPLHLTHTIPAVPLGDPNGKEDADYGEVGVDWASNLDNTPRTRSQVGPTYPAAERNAGITGEVLVEFIVDESGRVLNPRVVRSSSAAFETSTLRAVSKWRFEPGIKNGRAVRFRMMVPVSFSLAGI